jgi:hypothetical protein
MLLVVWVLELRILPRQFTRPARNQLGVIASLMGGVLPDVSLCGVVILRQYDLNQRWSMPHQYCFWLS